MAKPQDQLTKGDKPSLKPGDAAEPGTLRTGENVCPDCKASGQIESAPYTACGGTGKITKGIGGG